MKFPFSWASVCGKIITINFIHREIGWIHLLRCFRRCSQMKVFPPRQQKFIFRINPFYYKHFSFSPNRKDCKRCVVIYEKHQNVLQYKESECELEQNKPASAAISSVIRSDYNTDSRFQGNDQYLDAESTYHIIFIFHPIFTAFFLPFPLSW